MLLVIGGPAVAWSTAKNVPIADTGFSLTFPDQYVVSRPAGAPDILLQGDRPGGNGTVQVVRANPTESVGVIATGYEGKMRQALGNLNRQQTTAVALAGQAAELRTYRAVSNGMTIRVMAAFYHDGSRAFIIHSIDTTNLSGEFEAAITSLQGPAMVATPGPADAPVAAVTPLGDSGYMLTPPAGWRSFPASRPDGVQFGMADKSALLEALWLNVDVAAANPAALLEQTVTQLESGFGGGWQARERVPGSGGGDHSLFKRFGGQIGGVPAELLVYGVTDGVKMVLAYGYYAEAQAGLHRVAMRAAMTGIQRPGRAAMPAPMVSPGILPAALPAPVTPVAKPAPAKTIATPAVAAGGSAGALPAGFVYYHETTTGLEIPHPQGWVVERTAGSVTLSGPEGTPAYDTTINVQALRRADAANRDLATAVQTFSRGLQGQGAKIDVSDAGMLAGAPAHFIYAAAKVGHPDRQGYTHIFRYILIERPEVIAVVSYVSSIDDWERYRPIAQQSEAAIRFAGAAGAAPVATAPTAIRVSGPASAALAKLTSIEAWELLNERVLAKQWSGVMELLEPEAVRRFLLPNAETEARRAGVDLNTLPSDPLPRLQAILEQVPTATTLDYVARHPVKITKREENANQHLVMVEFAGNKQHYYWMRRVNGRWMHTPN